MIAVLVAVVVSDRASSGIHSAKSQRMSCWSRWNHNLGQIESKSRAQNQGQSQDQGEDVRYVCTCIPSMRHRTRLARHLFTVEQGVLGDGIS